MVIGQRPDVTALAQTPLLQFVADTKITNPQQIEVMKLTLLAKRPLWQKISLVHCEYVTVVISAHTYTSSRRYRI